MSLVTRLPKREDRTAQALTVKDMTTEGEISKNQDERNEARQDLRKPLTEVNAKVEHAGRDLRPDHLVESYPVAASLVAGAFGFFIDSTVKYRVTGPIVIATLLGFALSRRSSRNESRTR